MEEDKQDKRKNGDDLEDLLTEATQQTAMRAAQKRKAVEDILLRPSMLKMLDELVTGPQQGGQFILLEETHSATG